MFAVFLLVCNIGDLFFISGRRDYLGNDLRDKLERRHLSPRRYSPAQDARGRQSIRGQTQELYISSCFLILVSFLNWLYLRVSSFLSIKYLFLFLHWQFYDSCS